MCYLRRYDDLVEKFGRNWKAARKHYYVQGHKENRKYSCDDMMEQGLAEKSGPQPVRIQNDKEPFTCNGAIHYTRMSTDAIHKPKVAEAWSKVRNFGYFTINSDGRDVIQCNSHHLQDKSQMYWKQCFCEAKPQDKPRFCAKNGQKCNLCDGKIIQGYMHLKGNKKVATLEEIMNGQEFAFIDNNKTRAKSVVCDSATFKYQLSND